MFRRLQLMSPFHTIEVSPVCWSLIGKYPSGSWFEPNVAKLTHSKCMGTAPQSLSQNGFEIVSRILDERNRQELIACLGPVNGAGRRALLNTPAVAKLASSALLLDLVRPYLKCEPRPVRGIYFNKSAEINWLVAWHQDLTLALRSRIDLTGFGPWSIKDG